MWRETLVRVVKPALSESTWQRLRRIDPTSTQRDRQRAARAAKRRARAGSGSAASSAPDLSGMTLTELAVHFGTDKWGRHRYTPHYEAHLGHLQQERFTLLEIGIGGYARKAAGGASLRMWKHFFPRAQVLGLDIQDKSFVDEERIRTYRGSQVDEQLLRSVVGSTEDLRVVIDDGSHRNEHVLATFALLFPLLPDGAIYAIEDTQTSYWPRYGGSHGDGSAPTTMNLVKSLVDGLNYEEFTPPGYAPTYTELHVVGVHAYHNLVFIEKGRNEENLGHPRSNNQPHAPAESAPGDPAAAPAPTPGATPAG